MQRKEQSKRYQGWLQKYGKEEAERRFEEYQNRLRSHYDPEAIAKELNIFVEEAEKIAHERKLKRSQTLESFILRYGEEEGRKRFAEFSEKNSKKFDPEYLSKIKGITLEEAKEQIESWRKKAPKTLEDYIEKYGEEEGAKRYEKRRESVKKKGSPYDPQNIAKRLGVSLDEAEKIASKRKLMVSHSLDSYVAKYGEEEGKRKYEEFLEKMRSRGSSYDPHNVAKRLGVSLEEAEQIVEERKNKTRGTLENFILRYGEEGWRRRFDEFRDKSKHTLEKFIEKYGEEGEKKYQDYLKSKDCRSEDYFKKKYDDQWEQKQKEVIDNWKRKLTLEYMIEVYGEEGRARYERMNAKKKITYDQVKQKHGEEYAKLWKLGFSSIFRKLKEEYDLDTAIEKYEEYLNERKDRSVNKTVRNVSGSSTIFFTKLQERLGRTLIFGSRSVEKVIQIDEKRRLYYDCFDEETNTLIEYQGSMFHYHPSFGEDWVGLYGITIEESLRRDFRKKKAASDSGYNYIEVWDFEEQEKLDQLAKLLHKGETQ